MNPKIKIVSISAIGRAALGSAALMMLGGCASIVHGGNRNITVNTRPAGAKAVITTEAGEAVSVQTTPFTIALNPKKGYFKGQAYRIKFDLAGYRSSELEVRPELTGWYWGNLLFGGLIGMVVVDPLTGAMWNLTPDQIDRKLDPAQASMIKNRTGFVVILASQATAREKAAMTRIN